MSLRGMDAFIQREHLAEGQRSGVVVEVALSELHHWSVLVLRDDGRLTWCDADDLVVRPQPGRAGRSADQLAGEVVDRIVKRWESRRLSETRIGDIYTDLIAIARRALDNQGG